MYEGESICSETCVRETATNVEVHWAEHNNINKKSEPSKR